MRVAVYFKTYFQCILCDEDVQSLETDASIVTMITSEEANIADIFQHIRVKEAKNL